LKTVEQLKNLPLMTEFVCLKKYFRPFFPIVNKELFKTKLLNLSPKGISILSKRSMVKPLVLV
jgi:DNA polymerase sigma